MMIKMVPLETMRLAPGDPNMNTQDLKGRLTSILLEDLSSEKRHEVRQELNLESETNDELLAPKLLSREAETIYDSEGG